MPDSTFESRTVLDVAGTRSFPDERAERGVTGSYSTKSSCGGTGKLGDEADVG